ncbi:hypothetical protein K438DRAFT_1772163 [Mycena galopus ATCC 62051]|nr:hypothetical protein K438DRAFT_1772163 [Mycena galopus ATCC 62051]
MSRIPTSVPCRSANSRVARWTYYLTNISTIGEIDVSMNWIDDSFNTIEVVKLDTLESLGSAILNSTANGLLSLSADNFKLAAGAFKLRANFTDKNHGELHIPVHRVLHCHGGSVRWASERQLDDFWRRSDQQRSQNGVGSHLSVVFVNLLVGAAAMFALSRLTHGSLGDLEGNHLGLGVGTKHLAQLILTEERPPGDLDTVVKVIGNSVEIPTVPKIYTPHNSRLLQSMKTAMISRPFFSDDDSVAVHYTGPSSAPPSIWFDAFFSRQDFVHSEKVECNSTT